MYGIKLPTLIVFYAAEALAEEYNGKFYLLIIQDIMHR